MKCSQPGCAGTIEDGFCSVCGIEGLAAPGNEREIRSSAAATNQALPFVPVTSSTGNVGTVSSTSARNGTSSSRRTTRSSRRTSSRRQLGLGLVQVPELPPLDPTTVVMQNPEVPPNKRFCPNCEQSLKREHGFCPKCGQEYSFQPSLRAGDLVDDQYEVLGCLAFGGLGWIYLARDKTLNRWVVLKGLLNSRDAATAAAAVAERQFLAAVKHANIVGIYNFVTKGNEGYIVMEYVAGRTLKAIRKERGPLPPAEAIAYIHRILGAFSYLHRFNPPLVYCDFKPENIMLEGDDVKLIDMGGVRKVDDPGGDIYGTVGYSAPEADKGPTPVSDLFTVARTLLVLLSDFRGLQSSHRYDLPPLEEAPALVEHPALLDFLVKATHSDPERRFQSADEMADQLAGVLRQVAAKNGLYRTQESNYFGSDRIALGGGKSGVSVASLDVLPLLKLDPLDSAATFLFSLPIGSKVETLLAAYRQALPGFPDSLELPLRILALEIQSGQFARAAESLNNFPDSYDWRPYWYKGLLHSAQNNLDGSLANFTAVAKEIPGELPPLLAQGIMAEKLGQFEMALSAYSQVAQTDPQMVSALFGLARVQAAVNQRDEAITTLQRIDKTSPLYAEARCAIARTLTSGSFNQAQFKQALQVIDESPLDEENKTAVQAELYLRAIDSISVNGAKPAVKPDLPSENRLRRQAEKNLRQLARAASKAEERKHLINLANQARPHTLI
jgi:serine/threonine-protein kinase PknG